MSAQQEMGKDSDTAFLMVDDITLKTSLSLYRGINLNKMALDGSGY
jgi:hypothetical protein